MGTWLIVRRLAQEANPFGALAYAWIAGTLLLATIYGMESALAVLLLALGIAAAPRRVDEWITSRALACGAATSLLFLTRLDALPWLMALDAVLLAAALGGHRRRMLPLVALIGAVQFIAVGGYFLGNWLTWGHVLSISAALKAARAPLFSLEVPRSLLFLLAVGVTALGLRPLVDFLRAVRGGSTD